MNGLGPRVRVFVRREATDMRSSYDTLVSLTEKVLGQNPFSGHLFLFVNKKRSSCKCLYYDGTGFIIISKRLDHGRFTRFNPLYRKKLVFNYSEYSLFLEGAQMEKKFLEPPPKRHQKDKKRLPK